MNKILTKYHILNNQSEDDPDGAVRVMSTGNVQHLQLLMDPATGQHYINVQNPNGTQQLLPVQVTAVADSSATPLTLSCPDVQNLTDGKAIDKEMFNFSKTESRPSLLLLMNQYRKLSVHFKLD
ncbi:unnamed protein product [Onchocerca ochengi]|uniref:Ig-like_bact domain-containing protein n=1 Tax=Onchocerca ochengi TaxID=42157 RepID=A0A182EWT4_ONCOC|nr:unnamed protein product [Onchocerca ochengi]